MFTSRFEIEGRCVEDEIVVVDKTTIYLTRQLPEW